MKLRWDAAKIANSSAAMHGALWKPALQLRSTTSHGWDRMWRMTRGNISCLSTSAHPSVIPWVFVQGARKKPQKSKKFPNAILRDAPWYIMVKSRVPQQVLVSSFIMLSTPADRQNHITIIIKSNIKIHFTLNFLGLPGTQKHGNKIIPRHLSNHCRLWFCTLNPGSSKMISSGSCSTLPFGRVHFTSE